MKVQKGLILTVAFLILSLLVAGSSCKSEHVPSPPLTPPLSYYENNIFGFSLGYPSEWEAMETGDFSPLVVIKPLEEDLPLLAVSVSYGAEILSPDKVADNLMADILTSPGAKVVSEEEVDLEEKATAFEIIFSLGRGEPLPSQICQEGQKTDHQHINSNLLKQGSGLCPFGFAFGS